MLEVGEEVAPLKKEQDLLGLGGPRCSLADVAISQGSAFLWTAMLVGKVGLFFLLCVKWVICELVLMN